MKKRVTADLKRFYCKISFVIECSKSDFDNVVEHYERFCAFYNIEGKFYPKVLMNEESPFEHFDFVAIFQKTQANNHLSTIALRNILLNDLEIIRQLHYINEPEFECPNLSGMMYL
jgi:hypothetical protein